MATLTLQPFVARDLSGYDSPRAVGRDTTTHLAIAAVLVVTVVVILMGMLIWAASSTVTVLRDAVAFVFRLVVTLFAVIAVLTVLLLSKKGAVTGGPTPTPTPATKAPTTLLAPGSIR